MSIDSKESSRNKKTARGYSHSEAHSIEYLWEINEITSFIKSAKTTEDDVDIHSPEFSTGAKIKDLWLLQLEIKKDDDESKNKSWLSLHLYTKIEGQKVRTKFMLFFLNNKKGKVLVGNVVYNESSLYWVDRIFNGSPGSGWGYTKFIKIEEILNKNTEFLQNDTLTVGVDLIVYDDYMKINNPCYYFQSSKQTLADDFKSLLVTEEKCDVIIKVGNKKFDVHKFILTTRSSVFDAMFSHDMKENKEKEVTIPDIEPEVFKRLLNFIYTDNVEDLDSYAEDLLELSDRYQLQGLRIICEDSLVKTLSVKNAIRVLILADRHNAKRLGEFTINYIVIKLASLKNTAEYKALEESQPALFLAVLKKQVGGIGTD